jgi:hypothetical protein
MEVQRYYGLRTRHLRRPRANEHDAAADRESPEAVAAIAVGLKPKSLTKQERQLFSSEISSYLELRWGNVVAAAHGAWPLSVPLPVVLSPRRLTADTQERVPGAMVRGLLTHRGAQQHNR